jgi:ubiquitin carboxyl-terminal hydrolase 7
LIKPEKDGRWFKYDDDRVVPVSDKEVTEDNYGGDMSNGLAAPNQLARQQPRTMKRFTNAYMLVYVRDDAIGDVLKPFGPDDTPSHLSGCIRSFLILPLVDFALLSEARLDKERAEREAARREKDEQHLYLTAKVCLKRG